MTVLKAGADAGNNSLKLCVKGLEEPMLIPTVYSLYMGHTTALMDMEDIPLNELENNIDITIYSPKLSLNGSRLIVGEKVIDDNLPGLEMEKKSDKSTDEVPFIVTLAGLAVSAMKLNPNKSHIKVNYDLSVALPVGAITPKSAEANAKRYEGIHSLTYHHPSGNEVTIDITIEFCKCLPEGSAAAWGIVYDEKGKVKERKIDRNNGVAKINYLNKTLLHFDIGAGTTEIVITQGVKFNPKLSEGLGYGVKSTILEIIKRWNRENPLKSIDSMAEFNEILLNSEHGRHLALVNYEHTRNGFHQLALKLSQEIINKIDDMKDDPHVFIYGGGSLILKPYLQEILKHKNRMTNVMFLNEPLFVNARGLLVYTCSPRFDEQKQNQTV